MSTHFIGAVATRSTVAPDGADELAADHDGQTFGFALLRDGREDLPAGRIRSGLRLLFRGSTLIFRVWAKIAPFWL
jgi:hypothetical protein